MIKSLQKNKNMENKGSYGRRVRANNEIDKKLGWRGDVMVTCPVGAHQVPMKKFLQSVGMCSDCEIIVSADMEKLADERDEARSEHCEYLTATL